VPGVSELLGWQLVARSGNNIGLSKVETGCELECRGKCRRKLNVDLKVIEKSVTFSWKNFI
jgi:hypothetical protein